MGNIITLKLIISICKVKFERKRKKVWGSAHLLESNSSVGDGLLKNLNSFSVCKSLEWTVQSVGQSVAQFLAVPISRGLLLLLLLLLALCFLLSGSRGRSSSVGGRSVSLLCGLFHGRLGLSLGLLLGLLFGFLLSGGYTQTQTQASVRRTTQKAKRERQEIWLNCLRKSDFHGRGKHSDQPACGRDHSLTTLRMF